MVSAIQEVALRMCFARRISLTFLLFAFATTGQAVLVDAAALILGHNAKFRK